VTAVISALLGIRLARLGWIALAVGVVSDRVRKFRRPAAEPVSFSPEV